MFWIDPELIWPQVTPLPPPPLAPPKRNKPPVPSSQPIREPRLGDSTLPVASDQDAPPPLPPPPR